MASVDGYIGLAPDDDSNGPSYIAELYNQKLVSDKIITVDLNILPLASKITFGGLDTETVAETILYYPQTDPKKWELELWDFKIGDYSIDGQTTKVSIDTFFRPMLIPSTAFDKFADHFNKTYKNVTCNTTVGNCYFFGTCASRMS